MDVIARNNVKVLGTGGKTVLFVHGFGTDQRLWRHIAQPLAETNTVVLFDFVGAGESDSRAYTAERYSDLNGYAQDVLEVCRALDLRDVVYIGHSVAGMIGVRAALEEPTRFVSLGLVGASARYVDEPPDYVGGFTHLEIEELLEMMEHNFIEWVHTFAPRAVDDPEHPEFTDELTQSFCRIHHSVMQRFARATFFSDSRALLGKVRVPTWLFQTAQDLVVPPQAAEYLHQHIPGSTLVHLRSNGHYPPMSHPQELLQRLAQHLQLPLLS